MISHAKLYTNSIHSCNLVACLWLCFKHMKHNSKAIIFAECKLTDHITLMVLWLMLSVLSKAFQTTEHNLYISLQICFQFL